MPLLKILPGFVVTRTRQRQGSMFSFESCASLESRVADGATRSSFSYGAHACSRPYRIESCTAYTVPCCTECPGVHADFSLPKCVAIVGPGGTGKSAMLCSLCGQHPKKGPFLVGSGCASVTKKIKKTRVCWFGDSNNPSVDLVDTPGKACPASRTA